MAETVCKGCGHYFPQQPELPLSESGEEMKQSERLAFSDFTFGMIKPKAIRQYLEELIIQRIEREGLTVVKRKLMRLTNKQVDEIYPFMQNEFFYDDLKKFLMSGPVMALIVAGNGSDVAKKLVKIKGHSREPGTIRGDFFYRDWIEPEDVALWVKGAHPRQAEITSKMVAQNRLHSLESRELAYWALVALFTTGELDEVAHRIGRFKEFLESCAAQAKSGELRSSSQN